MSIEARLEKFQEHTRLLDFIVIIAGSLSLVLGVAVLVGWHIHSVALVQVHSTFAPMQYNAAVGFLLCGAGLLALLARWMRLATVCGIGASVIGLLTLFEYAFGVTLGLDQILMLRDIPMKTFHPGRMAPNTALSFVLIGLAYVAMNSWIRYNSKLIIAGLLGALVLAIGMVACVGYLTGVKEAYGWGYFTDMAVHTTVGLMALGAGTLTVTQGMGRQQEIGVLQRLAVLIGLAVVVITLLLWQALIGREQAYVEARTRVQTAHVQNEIAARIESRVMPLVRLAKRWERRGRPSQQEWDAEAQLYVDHFRDTQALAWADATFHVRWIMPPEENAAILSRQLAYSGSHQKHLEMARDSREVTVTPPFDLPRDGLGFHIYVPLFPDAGFDGFIVAVFPVEILLDTILQNVALNYAIAVFVGQQKIYARDATNEQYEQVWGQEGTVGGYGVTWRVRLWPKSEPLTEGFSRLPDIVLATGLLTAVLIMLTVNFGQTTKLHARQVEHANQQLQREVGDRQRAERALQASQHFLQSTLDALPTYIAILDQTGTIVAVNAAWRHASEVDGHEWPFFGIGVNYLEACDAAAAEETAVAQTAANGIRQVMAQQQEAFNLEYAIHGSTGQKWFLLRVTRFETAQELRVVVAHEDISEVKRAEEELARQQETLFQREKLAAMGSLLASVAHELNNPLSVVMMQSDLLAEEVASGPLAELAGDIAQAAERCVRIVRNFLMLARQHPPERSHVHVNAVVEEAMALLVYPLRVDDIDVALQLADDLPSLWADPHQLHQVVVNLVTNAHQALRETSTPRRLTITTGTNASRTRVFLEVADTGPGIPPALQSRIFEPFFTTKPADVGTGLGLPLCRGIVEEHGGTLQVESQPTHGTVFRVELPVETMPATVVPPPAADIPAQDQERHILVVDDEVGIANALAYLLRRDGYQVDTAANGRLALESLQEQSYDLILCDLRMPELDGPGFYQELEQRYPHLCQRIVFLTGDVLSENTRAFLERIDVLRLTKPFTAEEARRTVRQAVQAM